MKNIIYKILNKYYIGRYFLGILISIKFIIFDKKFTQPKNVSYTYIINDFAQYYAKMLIEKEEYFFLYKFYKYNKYEKKKYITRRKFAVIEKKLSKDIKEVFWNKEKFLKQFSKFVKRTWIDLETATEEDIMKFIEKNKKIIIKPKMACLGNGIKIIKLDNLEMEKNFIKEYRYSSYIAEEYIDGNKELEEFHPESLNTIRVVTFYNGKEFLTFGAFLRMGNNNQCIDNAHAGGIFATIDIKTGIVISKGISSNGTEYIKHPQTGKQIIGFKIPKWKEILEVCEQATKHIPNIKIAGWDVAINKKNEIIIIEANHMPDIDLMQAPLNLGLRNEIEKILKKLYNIKVR